MRVVAPGLRKQQVRDLLCMVFVEARAVAQEANSDVERDSSKLDQAKAHFDRRNCEASK